MIRLLCIQRLPNKEQRHTIVPLLQVNPSELVSHLDRKMLFRFRGLRNNEIYTTQCSLWPFSPLTWTGKCVSSVCRKCVTIFYPTFLCASSPDHVIVITETREPSQLPIQVMSAH